MKVSLRGRTLVAVHPLGAHAVEEVTEANLGNGTVAATGATTLQGVRCAGHELLRREGLQGARGDGSPQSPSLQMPSRIRSGPDPSRGCKCTLGTTERRLNLGSSFLNSAAPLTHARFPQVAKAGTLTVCL